MPAFVWSFVFGFAAGESRTLASFRRSYNSTADKTLSAGRFYQRLTTTLAEYLCDLVEQGLDEVAVPDTVDADLSRFRDVMVADGTILRLHLLHNVTDQTIERFNITDKKTHDSTEFETGSWLEDRLVLFDQAYFKYRRFALIDESDGYFMSRLKSNANPVIMNKLQECRGDAIPLEGEKVQDVVDDLYRQHIDVGIEAEFQRKPYAGT